MVSVHLLADGRRRFSYSRGVTFISSVHMDGQLVVGYGPSELEHGDRDSLPFLTQTVCDVAVLTPDQTRSVSINQKQKIRVL